MTAVLGIDPGRLGALATVSATGNVLRLEDMPKTNDAIRAAVASAFNDAGGFHAQPIAILEVPASSHGRPVRGITRLLHHAGYLHGVCDSMGFKTHTVRPSAWKRFYGLNSDKAPGVQLARELFPKANLEGPRGGIRDGRAEALLVAHLWSSAAGRDILTQNG